MRGLQQVSELGSSQSECTPQNLFVELVEFLYFSVVQHFSRSVREHAGKLALSSSCVQASRVVIRFAIFLS